MLHSMYVAMYHIWICRIYQIEAVATNILMIIIATNLDFYTKIACEILVYCFSITWWLFEEVKYEKHSF